METTHVSVQLERTILPASKASKVALKRHIQAAPNLKKKSRAIPLLTVGVLMACSRVKFIFFDIQKYSE
jgi:hypothetical protein